ncbi:hypothetical protein Acr_17g0001310 [Actinidia rufa]|uniref:Uncharacterized protein n=1 Tax=Actinidia rufa TaxID=165716 RepID=A0A7J0G1B0_9ERIC|nr:hypothetical protein Acr_17g0001310 [Actinidia rufa]
MVLELAISLISSLPSLLLHGLATIFLSLISSSIGLQIHPQPEMDRQGVPPSVVTRPPRGVVKILFCPRAEGGRTSFLAVRSSQDRLSLSRLNKKIGEEEPGGFDFIWVNYTDLP